MEAGQVHSPVSAGRLGHKPSPTHTETTVRDGEGSAVRALTAVWDSERRPGTGSAFRGAQSLPKSRYTRWTGDKNAIKAVAMTVLLGVWENAWRESREALDRCPRPPLRRKGKMRSETAGSCEVLGLQPLLPTRGRPVLSQGGSPTEEEAGHGAQAGLWLLVLWTTFMSSSRLLPGSVGTPSPPSAPAAPSVSRGAEGFTPSGDPAE